MQRRPARHEAVDLLQGKPVANFKLFQFDPIQEVYIENPSVLRRGVGYFIQPITTNIIPKTPATDPTTHQKNATAASPLLPQTFRGNAIIAHASPIITPTIR